MTINAKIGELYVDKRDGEIVIIVSEEAPKGNSFDLPNENSLWVFTLGRYFSHKPISCYEKREVGTEHFKSFWVSLENFVNNHIPQVGEMYINKKEGEIVVVVSEPRQGSWAYFNHHQIITICTIGFYFDPLEITGHVERDVLFQSFNPNWELLKAFLKAKTNKER